MIAVIMPHILVSLKQSMWLSKLLLSLDVSWPIASPLPPKEVKVHTSVSVDVDSLRLEACLC